MEKSKSHRDVLGFISLSGKYSLVARLIVRLVPKPFLLSDFRFMQKYRLAQSKCFLGNEQVNLKF
jgi:hypothetical protein